MTVSEDVKDYHKSSKSKNKSYTVKVLSSVREAQLSHGLRHNDYQLYRQYCTRRIRRIRKSLSFVQGDRKNFRKKEVTTNLLKDARYLYIPIMTLERYWAFAMQLKEESVQEPRKKFSMRNKLRKASEYAVNFQKIVEAALWCDDRTQLEVQGYCLWLQGTVLFEMAEFTNEWELPVKFFNNSHVIYSKLSSAVSDEEVEAFKLKLRELEVKLRYCKHHLGDKAATDTLLSMNEDDALGAKLDKLLANAREKQASTLSEVEWKGRILSVKHEKVRLFLLNESLIGNELLKTTKAENRVERLDKLLMHAKDAIQIVKEDLKNDPSFKSRSSEVSSLNMLHSYLAYLKLKLTVLRNLAMYHWYHQIINEENQVGDSKKSPKIQDMVRLCDLSVQNLNEMLSLSGLENDLEIIRLVDEVKVALRAHRCFYIAEHFAKLEKWSEALALYERTHQLSEKALKFELEAALKESLEKLLGFADVKRFSCQAKVLLSVDDTSKNAPKLDKKFSNKYLIDRLDEYYEDESLLSNSPMVVPVPPEMSSVPCKPLFFDLALNHVDFPSIDHKLAQDSPAKSGLGGIKGLVKGLWGWGS